MVFKRNGEGGQNAQASALRRLGPYKKTAAASAKATHTFTATVSQETLEEATLRLQQARADTESLDATKREIEIQKLKGSLVEVSDVRDEMERLHLAWVAELEQIPQAAIGELPGTLAASLHQTIRAAIESACTAARNRIADQ